MSRSVRCFLCASLLACAGMFGLASNGTLYGQSTSRNGLKDEQPATCPSATATDFGVCLNAATAARQVNFADGDFATSTILEPQPGQVLRFGVGTYTFPQIRIADSTTERMVSNSIEGEGEQRTVLQQASTAHGPAIVNTHFSALTGTDSFFGAGFVRLSGFTLNAGAASADCTVKIYGYAMVFRDVTLQHGGTCNRYTEWTGKLDGLPAPLTYNPSGLFDHVTQFDARGNGVEFRGPLDSQFRYDESYKNGGWAYFLTQAANVNYIQAIESDHAHPGTTGSIYVNGIGNGQIPAGLNGDTVYADNDQRVGTMIYYGPNNGSLKLSHSNITGGAIGLHLNGGHGNYFQGEINGTAMTAVKIEGGSLDGRLAMSGNTGYHFDFAREATPSSITSVSYDALGTAFLHMPSGSDTLELMNLPPFGATRERNYFNTPGAAVRMNGQRYGMPASGDRLLAVDTSNGVNLTLEGAPGKGHQTGMSFKTNGASKIDCGLQDDGSYFCFDAATGHNFLTVSTSGVVTYGEGPNAPFVVPSGAPYFPVMPFLPNNKAATGTRFVCVDTKGQLTTSAMPCSGS